MCAVRILMSGDLSPGSEAQTGRRPLLMCCGCDTLSSASCHHYHTPPSVPQPRCFPGCRDGPAEDEAENIPLSRRPPPHSPISLRHRLRVESVSLTQILPTNSARHSPLPFCAPVKGTAARKQTTRYSLSFVAWLAPHNSTLPQYRAPGRYTTLEGSCLDLREWWRLPYVVGRLPSVLPGECDPLTTPLATSTLGRHTLFLGVPPPARYPYG